MTKTNYHTEYLVEVLYNEHPEDARSSPKIMHDLSQAFIRADEAWDYFKRDWEKTLTFFAYVSIRSRRVEAWDEISTRSKTSYEV
jgi:hypothetical protein